MRFLQAGIGGIVGRHFEAHVAGSSVGWETVKRTRSTVGRQQVLAGADAVGRRPRDVSRPGCGSTARHRYPNPRAGAGHGHGIERLGFRVRAQGPGFHGDGAFLTLVA